jgi:hypothetical protein
MTKQRLCMLGCALVLIGACKSDESTEDGGGAGAGGSSGEGSSGAGGASGSSGSSGSSGAGASGASGGGAGTGGVSAGAGGVEDSGMTQEDASAGAGGSGHMPIPTECAETSAEAPSATWVNATGMLAGMASECGNLTLVAAHPCSELVIAGVAKVGLYATTDSGDSWTKLGSGAGSDSIGHRPSSIVFDPEHPEIFYETGIYGALNDGIYKTDDGGTTLKKLGEIGHLDLVSVDFGDPERKTLLAGVHETKRRLWLSNDGGESWNDIGMALPEDSHFSSAPLVLDPEHFLLGACGWGDGTCGVLASDDAGGSWQSKSTEAPAGQPLWMKNGNMVWPTIYGSGALISDDSGASWMKVDGPRSTPVELPDGRIVAVGGDHLIISTDSGASWTNIGEPLPYQAAGVAYSAAKKTFFIWHNDCGDAVLADAIMSAGLRD